MIDCNNSSVIFFNCYNESRKVYQDKFARSSYLQTADLNCLFLEEYEHSEKPVRTFKLDYDIRTISGNDIISLFMLIRKCYLQLQRDATTHSQQEDAYYFDIRRDICKALQLIRRKIEITLRRNALLDIIAGQCQSLFDIVGELKHFDESFLKKCLSHVNGHRIDAVSYNYLHLHFDIRYLLLTMIYKMNRSSANLSLIVERYFNKIIFDLIKLSGVNFNLLNDKEKLFTKMPFTCICIEEFWLLLQLFIEKIRFQEYKSFWTYYNSQLDAFNKSTDIDSNKKAKFNIWLTCGVSKLQNYNQFGDYSEVDTSRNDANTKVLVDSFKTMASVRDAEGDIYKCLALAAPLLSSRWISDVSLEVYQYLWEFFWKQINNDLLHQYPKNVKTIVDFVNHTSKETINPSTGTCYELFLNLLCNHFKYHSDIALWNRLKGRVYSRLSPKNINELSDNSVFNLLFLFLCVNNVLPAGTDVCEKMHSILNDFSPNKQQSTVILHVYTAFIVIHPCEDEHLRKISDALLRIVTVASNDRNNGRMMRSFIEGIHECPAHRDYEHLLIGSWIKNYASWCSKLDLNYFLDVIIKLCTKHWTNGSKRWDQICKEHVLPCLKTIAETDQSATYQVGEIAASILLKHFDELTKYFSVFAGDRSSPKMMAQFLLCLVNSTEFRLCYTDEQFLYKVVQAWLRGCIVFSDNRMAVINEEIAQLPIMEIVENKMRKIDRHVPDTFKYFVKGLEVELRQRPEKLASLRIWCENIFANLSEWTYMYAKTSEFESAEVLRVYECIGSFINFCPSIVYMRARPNCILTKIVATMLLPTEVLMGKRPLQSVLDAVKGTLHLFIKGIAKLNYDQDPYLERTLQDLIIKYLPHFDVEYVNDSPLFKCLDEDLGNFVMEKVAMCIKQAKNDPRVLEKALAFSEKIVNDRSVSSERLRIIVDKVFPVILELIMNTEQVNASKKLAISVVENTVLANEYSHVKDDAVKCLMKFTEQHIAFRSRIYFPFVSILLVKVMPNEVNEIVPFLKEHIANVERLRGVGYDNNLRTGLKKIENAVSVCLKK